MSEFENWIARPDIQERIMGAGVKLEGYLQNNYEVMYPAQIAEQAKAWLSNFAAWDESVYDHALRLLEYIEIHRDDDIQKQLFNCLANEITGKFNTTKSHIYICPMGEESESSFRLSAIFNNANEGPWYSSDINKLLEKVKDDERAVILFFDDFLFSGGQQVCIFKKLLGIPLAPGDTDDMYAQRKSIRNPDLRDVFKKTPIALYYHLGFQEGLMNEAFDDFVKEQGLAVKKFTGNAEKGSNGCFGTKDDVHRIKSSSRYPLSTGAFAGQPPVGILPLYNILQEAGEALLRIEHPASAKWNDERFCNNALGYGGNAKLIIGEQNVPTCTLTALWLPSPQNKETSIVVQGKTINWKSFLYRKPKGKSGTTEAAPEKTYPHIPVKTISTSTPFTDPVHYDLLTRLALNRRPCIYIYGYEKETGHYPHATDLNDIETGLDSIQQINKREWYAYTLEDGNTLLKLGSQINNDLKRQNCGEFGLLIQCESANHSPIQPFAQQIISAHPDKKISLVMIYPGCQPDELKKIAAELPSTRESRIYRAAGFSFTEPARKDGFSMFSHSHPHEQITCFIGAIIVNGERLALEQFKENFKLQITVFSTVKPVSTENFSPQKFIEELSALHQGSPEEEQSSWESFYKALLQICTTHAPQHLESLIYFAARSNDPFIRFSTLAFALQFSNGCLIDYWVEGSGAGPEQFKGLEHYIHPAAKALFNPLLRYFNRHREKPGLADQVLLLLQSLEAALLHDYPIAEKMVTAQPHFTKELEDEPEMTLIKLLDAGFDPFIQMPAALPSSARLSEALLEKMILAPPMTNRKINWLKQNLYFILT